MSGLMLFVLRQETNTASNLPVFPSLFRFSRQGLPSLTPLDLGEPGSEQGVTSLGPGTLPLWDPSFIKNNTSQ